MTRKRSSAEVAADKAAAIKATPSEMANTLRKIRQKNKKILDLMAGEDYIHDDDIPELVPEPPVSQATLHQIGENACSSTFDVSFVEMAILNGFLYDAYKDGNSQVKITAFGYADGIGRVNFGVSFDVTESYWFMGTIGDDLTPCIFHTKIFRDSNGNLITQLHLSIKDTTSYFRLEQVFKSIKKIAFNNSKFKGKCLKIKVSEGRFMGIEIIEVPKVADLILTRLQEKYKTNFIDRVRRGSSTRYLLNGTPGSGKTETIRDMIRQLMPLVTFVIPDFNNVDDLTTILEACEIFENAVVIMDDIDLFLGSRDNGSYTKLLGEFLAFFDGVKKRSISLLASTNDKGLVDAAAERPGRFNLTLDYTFLTDDQIKKVCEIHLPEEYRTDKIYKAFNTIDGKTAKITGAFIANLAENIKEMSYGDDKWGAVETIELIEESYRGFYSSQIKRNEKVGFLKDN